MTTTLSARRVVSGEPAAVVLLITGPDAAQYLARTTLRSVLPGEVEGVLHMAEGDERAIRVVTSPPRRTPTAYISEFRAVVDGMPASAGALRVMSAGPGQCEVDFSLHSEGEIPPALEDVFAGLSNGFFDGLERALKDRTAA